MKFLGATIAICIIISVAESDSVEKIETFKIDKPVPDPVSVQTVVQAVPKEMVTSVTSVNTGVTDLVKQVKRLEAKLNLVLERVISRKRELSAQFDEMESSVDKTLAILNPAMVEFKKLQQNTVIVEEEDDRRRKRRHGHSKQAGEPSQENLQRRKRESKSDLASVSKRKSHRRIAELMNGKASHRRHRSFPRAATDFRQRPMRDEAAATAGSGSQLADTAPPQPALSPLPPQMSPPVAPPQPGQQAPAFGSAPSGLPPPPAAAPVAAPIQTPYNPAQVGQPPPVEPRAAVPLPAGQTPPQGVPAAPLAPGTSSQDGQPLSAPPPPPAAAVGPSQAVQPPPPPPSSPQAAPGAPQAAPEAPQAGQPPPPPPPSPQAAPGAPQAPPGAPQAAQPPPQVPQTAAAPAAPQAPPQARVRRWEKHRLRLALDGGHPVLIEGPVAWRRARHAPARSEEDMLTLWRRAELGPGPEPRPESQRLRRHAAGGFAEPQDDAAGPEEDPVPEMEKQVERAERDLRSADDGDDRPSADDDEDDDDEEDDDNDDDDDDDTSHMDSGQSDDGGEDAMMDDAAPVFADGSEARR